MYRKLELPLIDALPELLCTPERFAKNVAAAALADTVELAVVIPFPQAELPFPPAA